MQQERQMLEELLRERQNRERERFEIALDSRLEEIRAAQERARQTAEDDRRRIEDERRRVEEERRRVEEERRRLAEDQTRAHAEDVARESVRRELERTRTTARTVHVEPGPAASGPATRQNLSPRERAAEDRMRTVREQRALDRRRREEAARIAAQDPEALAREKRLRAAIEKADRTGSKTSPSSGARAEHSLRSPGERRLGRNHGRCLGRCLGRSGNVRRGLREPRA